jgi:hypothetical protein
MADRLALFNSALPQLPLSGWRVPSEASLSTQTKTIHTAAIER